MKDKVKIVKFDEIPKSIYDIPNEDGTYDLILKGASIEIPWGEKRIVLEKLNRGYYYDKWINKTEAKRRKIPIHNTPVAYQIQNYNFRIILLYEIMEE